MLANTDAAQQSAHWKPQKYPLNEVSREAVYDAFVTYLLL
jgi:hypothetical protein